MYLTEVEFRMSRMTDCEQVRDATEWLASASRKNGQALGRELPMVETSRALTLFLLLPEKDSLAAKHHNNWVRLNLQKIKSAGATGPFVTIRGKESSGLMPCACRSRSSHVLFTTYSHIDSPLRCGECFLPVPLYKVKPWRDDEYGDIISWESNYHSCDHLYMNSGAGERFGLRQTSTLNSALTAEGREVCRLIEAQTGKPVYYYLFRYGGRSRQKEQARRCPSCGREWLLKTIWHNLFDFRCDRCHLVSNIAWDVR